MTSRSVHVWGAALLLAATAGCTRKALQKLDGGVGTIPGSDGGLDVGGGDGDGVTDVRSVVDTSLDVGFAGRRSYVVTSQVSVDGAVVTSHSFTVTIDTRKRIGFIGTGGSADAVTLEQTASGALRFGRVLSFGVPVSAACGGSVAFDDVSVTIDASGVLSGGGTGRLITYPADVAMTVAATIDLTSVPDLEAPTLSLSASSDLADPWASLWIVASEPLPGDQMAPVLQAGSGEVVTFDGVPTGADTTFAVLEKPRRLLRYHETYQITFDTLTDFAGNPARWSNDRAFFTTRDAPPLVAADGFESTMDETVGGAQILSGAGAPTITGARSLYIPPAASLGAAGFATQLAMRLPIPAGARMLRFAYRIVDPGPDSGTFYVIGSVGGTLVNVSLSSNAEGVTYATIGQDRVGLAPMITAAIALPPDVHDDIVFVRIASQAGSCAGPPPPPVPGIILDDMRAE